MQCIPYFMVNMRICEFPRHRIVPQMLSSYKTNDFMSGQLATLSAASDGQNYTCENWRCDKETIPLNRLIWFHSIWIWKCSGSFLFSLQLNFVEWKSDPNKLKRHLETNYPAQNYKPREYFEKLVTESTIDNACQFHESYWKKTACKL